MNELLIKNKIVVGDKGGEQVNYAELDAGRSFAYKAEKKTIALKHGYQYITEACVSFYLEYGTIEAAKMMEMSKEGFSKVLQYIGIERNKAKRGGRRAREGKLNEDMARKAKFVWDGESVDKHYCEALKTILGVNVSNNCMRSMLRGETWGDVV